MSRRKQRIGAAFSAAAGTYDTAALAQIHAADLLAGRLPGPPLEGRILELGCGTGLFTRRLLERLDAQARLLATDLSPRMVERARAGLGDPRLGFVVLDAEAPEPAGGPFDLIASSLAAQWFADLPATLARLAAMLRPGGTLLIATLGAGTFAEWRAAHAALGLRSGVADYPDAGRLAAMLAGATVESERFAITHADARAFLRSLDAVGAGTPRPGHRPLPAGTLRRIMASLGRPCSITWEVLILSMTKKGNGR
ncbi:methyltransferase domain-containing protein [Magnetospirillum sp. SS-4]|uniref:methyltransferase domain-containing protein n=1 Tax=Magnetospirillum sp. SS-4 TaxID=2681465 RepID=UPI00137F8BD5|nr:methyltransferase domain-containing protein [Magnetospirillum sp. SS-4]CAA7626193.1 SAM-dependent methyltransferase [Magnetospirillum sp. SS-4]